MGFIERIEAAIGGEEDDEVETIVEGRRRGSTGDGERARGSGDDRERTGGSNDDGERGRSRTGTTYRCRSCGAGFDAPKPSCPRCGSAELYDASG